MGFTYYFEQPENELLEDISVGAEYDRYEWLDGDLDSDELEINLIGIRTLAGDFLGLEVEFERDILQEPFEIIDEVIIPSSEYKGIDFELEFRSSSNRDYYWI